VFVNNENFYNLLFCPQTTYNASNNQGAYGRLDLEEVF